MPRPPFSICICPDAGLIRSHMDTLLAQTPTEDGKPWEKSTFWGDEELPPRFWEKLTLQGLFATPTLVVLRQAQALNAAAWKRLSAALGTASAHTWTILCMEGAWEKKQPKIPAHIQKLPCMTLAEQKGWVWRSAGLDARTMKAHAQVRAKALGVRFAQGALDAFCAATAPDANAIETALQKLALATGLSDDGSVTADMIHQGGYTPEANIFSLISFLQAGNLPAAWREIRSSMQGGDNPVFALMALLHREARILWQLQAGESVRLFGPDASSKERLATQLGFSGIAALLTLVVRAEGQIKSGEQSPEQVLESLCVDAARLFRPDLVPVA